MDTPSGAGGSGRIRVAVVGAGGMANAVHYPSLVSFDDVEIAGICDLDERRRTATAEKYGIVRRYADYRRMVEEVAPDAVYVIGPPHLMYDPWVWCLEQGLNLYIEKPMGITIHQARSLAYLAERHGCITQVSFQRRSCPLLVKLREACLERGPMVHATCEFYKRQLEPDTSARGHVMDDSVHAIDTLRWACGGEVAEVQSVTGRVGVPDLNLIVAVLRFTTGATGVLLNSWSSGRRVFRVGMHAPGACAEADPEGKGVFYADGDTAGVEYDTREVSGGDELYVFGGFRAKNREFIDAVKGGPPPSSPFSDAVKTMEVAERILAQDLLR